jgi:hypothetical protein
MATAAVVIDIDGNITEHASPHDDDILHAHRTDHRNPLRASISDD